MLVGQPEDHSLARPVEALAFDVTEGPVVLGGQLIVKGPPCVEIVPLEGRYRRCSRRPLPIAGCDLPHRSDAIETPRRRSPAVGTTSDHFDRAQSSQIFEVSHRRLIGP